MRLVAASNKFDLLAGSTDPRFQRIVGITHDATTSLFTLYYRRTEDQVVSHQLRSTAYLLVDDRSVLTGINAVVKELAGPHPLRHIAVFPTETAANEARKQIAKRYAERFGQNSSRHFWWQPAIRALQFRTGITFFKGLQFTELKTLSIDIETYTARSKYFSDAADPEDQIIIISVCSSRGGSWLLTLEAGDEPLLLQQLNKLIIREDPDVICGHNLFGFDLPYLQTRAAKLKVPLGWGRDGSQLWQRENKRGLMRQEWVAAGRHLVDTLPALMQYDFTARNLPNYQLKTAVVHLGLAPDRRDFDRSRISELWQTDRQNLLQYAAADAADTLALYQFLLTPAFFQTQFLPFPYQDVCTLGTGTKVDCLISRNYMLRGQALPLKGSMDGSLDSGGLTDVLELGWVEQVAKADAASLYPSICLTYNIHPRQDHLGQFLATLRELTARRLQAKRELRQLSKHSLEYRSLDAWQGSLKILINSYYGMLGTGGLHFADPEAASAITAKGQSILKKMVNDVTASGGTPVEIDTDGIYFVPPASWSAGPEAYVEQVLNAGQDEGINIEFDGFYQAMYSYACKNYLLFGEGQIVRKGVVFRSRRLSGLQDQIITKFSELLADGRLADLTDYCRLTRQRISEGHLTRDEICTFAPVRADFKDYATRLLRGDHHNRAYDLILGRPDQAKWVERSRIVYYHRQGGFLALAEEFKADYDCKHYLELLDRTAEKFQFAFPPNVFKLIMRGNPGDEELRTWHFKSSAEQLRQYERERGSKPVMLSFLETSIPK